MGGGGADTVQNISKVEPWSGATPALSAAMQYLYGTTPYSSGMPQPGTGTTPAPGTGGGGTGGGITPPDQLPAGWWPGMVGPITPGGGTSGGNLSAARSIQNMGSPAPGTYPQYSIFPTMFSMPNYYQGQDVSQINPNINMNNIVAPLTQYQQDAMSQLANQGYTDQQGPMYNYVMGRLDPNGIGATLENAMLGTWNKLSGPTINGQYVPSGANNQALGTLGTILSTDPNSRMSTSDMAMAQAWGNAIYPLLQGANVDSAAGNTAQAMESLMGLVNGQPMAQDAMQTALNNILPMTSGTAAESSRNILNQGIEALLPIIRGQNVTPNQSSFNMALNSLNPIFNGENMPLINSALKTAVEQQINPTLQGQYLNPESNYALADYTSAAMRPLLEQYNEQFIPQSRTSAVQAGRGLSDTSALLQAQGERDLQRNMGDIAAKIYSTQYGDERNRQMQAANFAPDLYGNAINAQVTAAGLPLQALTAALGSQTQGIGAAADAYKAALGGQMEAAKLPLEAWKAATGNQLQAAQYPLSVYTQGTGSQLQASQFPLQGWTTTGNQQLQATNQAFNQYNQERGIQNQTAQIPYQTYQWFNNQFPSWNNALQDYTNYQTSRAKNLATAGDMQQQYQQTLNNAVNNLYMQDLYGPLNQVNALLNSAFTLGSGFKSMTQQEQVPPQSLAQLLSGGAGTGLSLAALAGAFG